MTGSEVTWRALAVEAETRLREAGIEHAGADAKWIVESASGWDAAERLAHLDERATTRGVATLDRMVARRAAGEPLQYVLGAWAFRTLDLLVDHRVLIPRPETEVVVDHVLAAVDGSVSHPPVVADLGTGSGAIALAVAAERAPAVRVWASDVSRDALDVARANLAGLGQAGGVVAIVEGPWFDALPAELRGRIDVVASNPPYVAAGDDLPPEVRDWEPHGALVAGPTGLEAIELLVRGAPHWLARPGTLVLEIGDTQGNAAAALATATGYDEVRIAPDLTGRDRVLIATRR